MHSVPAAAECDTDQSKLIHLRNTMKEKLQEIPNIKINGSDEYNSGSVLNDIVYRHKG